MQIIANRMPFAILHALQASRATPNLQHWQFSTPNPVHTLARCPATT